MNNTSTIVQYVADTFTANNSYKIKNVIDLNGQTITLPGSVTLDICRTGGFTNGTLVGDNTTIIADAYKIFDLEHPVQLLGTWNIGHLKPQWWGAEAIASVDSTDAIQKAIDVAYDIQKEVYFQSGIYVVTEALYVYDGIKLRGDGIYNTILRTPFAKTPIAKANVTRSIGSYNTVTDYNSGSFLDWDLEDCHNRFYIGDGNVGYYDGDRDTNPNHPLYYPEPSSDSSEHAAWEKWYDDRSRIQSQGRFVGKTGREGYGNGLIKSALNPTIFYPTRGNAEYNPANPGGHVHSGVRNVKISDMQINTNSSDRGKDSAINFLYKATSIPNSIRETYDSSVLNCSFEHLYIFGCGKDGISATRAVDWTIINCYIRQCAEKGINLSGVTSIFITGCYCNSCLEAGYRLSGVNYSTLSGCASDSCGTSYDLTNCNGITLDSCGSEATRLQLVLAEDWESGTELLYKGRSFVIRNCEGITLNSCYAMAAHNRDTDYALYEADADDIYDTGWESNTFVHCTESRDVSVNNCYFKAFRRVRSTPYRNANNEKCNYQGGPYDPTQPGSRYWQLQNYMPGQVYEIEGESATNNISIVANSREDKERSTLEIRWGNIDILDPGTVANPMGWNTAGKTISGRDNNGGWWYTESGETKQITRDNFEIICPINGTHAGKLRNFFWEWRNSLQLVRIETDDMAVTRYGEKGCVGYRTALNIQDDTTQVDWSNVSSTIMNKITIDIVSQYGETSMIDGSSSMFDYGTLFKEDLNDYQFVHKFQTTIPAYTRTSAIGDRVLINTNSNQNLSSGVTKATVGIVGNPNREITQEIQDLIDEHKYDAGEFNSGDILALLTTDSLSSLTKQFFGIYNKDGETMFGVSNDKDNGIITVKDHKFISTTAENTSNISHLSNAASTQSIIDKINSLIERLQAHGFIAEDPEPSGTTIRPLTDSYTSGNTELTISYQISSPDTLIYYIGIAYSSTNTSPDYGTNHVDSADMTENNGVYTGTIIVPRGSSSVNRYIRLYYETSSVRGASTRVYDDNVYYWSGSTLSIVNQ